MIIKKIIAERKSLQIKRELEQDISCFAIPVKKAVEYEILKIHSGGDVTPGFCLCRSSPG
jgi:hypothetical protein